MKKVLVGLGALAIGATGVLVADPVVAWKPKPKATHWQHQKLTGVRGVDVSRWQHVGPGRLDFQALQSQGVRFVVIKSGDSNWSAHREAGYWYARDKRAAKRAKLLVGAYYYAVPTSDSRRVIRDARAQARKAVRRVGGKLRKGHLPLALDLETEATSLGKRDLTRWAIAWLKVAEKRTGLTPWFYSYTRYLERRMLPDPRLQAYPFWHANWGLYLKDKPLQVKGWPDNHGRIWQFTDSGKLRGSGSSVIDLNEYRGTGAELLAEAGLKRKAAKRFDIDLDAAPTYRDQPAPSESPTPTESPTESPSPSAS